MENKKSAEEIAREIGAKRKKKNAKYSVDLASRTLLAVAIFWAVGGLYEHSLYEGSPIIFYIDLVNGIMTGVFLGLYFWSRKKPLIPLIIGFVIYLLVQILVVLSMQVMPFGLAVKVAIIILMATGIVNQIKAKKEKRAPSGEVLDQDLS